MRLIDAEKAIEAVCDKCPISFKEKCEWRDNGHCSMKVALEALPTVDAVEVVRCKDCKYSSIPKSNFADAYPMICHLRKSLTIIESGDCFCSYAERKDK